MGQFLELIRTHVTIWTDWIYGTIGEKLGLSTAQIVTQGFKRMVNKDDYDRCRYNPQHNCMQNSSSIAEQSRAEQNAEFFKQNMWQYIQVHSSSPVAAMESMQ